MHDLSFYPHPWVESMKKENEDTVHILYGAK